MKNYILIFEDKNGNELKREYLLSKNKIEAKKTADKIKANSMINDLHKIIIKN